MDLEKIILEGGEVAATLRSFEIPKDGELRVSFVLTGAGKVHTLSVSGLKEFGFDASEENVFRVLIESPLFWDYGPQSTIFGQAPLPDPYRFFLDFFGLIRKTYGLKRDPSRYLNWQSGLKDWLGFTYSRSYSLLTAPAPLVEESALLLDVQAASYIVLPVENKAGGNKVEDNSIAAPDLRMFVIGPLWGIASGEISAS